MDFSPFLDKWSGLMGDDEKIRTASDAAFDLINESGSGKLTHEEAQVALDKAAQKIGETCGKELHVPGPVAKMAISHYDKDKSGDLDKDEFFKLMKRCAKMLGGGKSEEGE